MKKITKILLLKLKHILFLSQELKKIIGEKIKLIPGIVNEIELSSFGKFKWIISEVSNNYINK